MAKRDKSRDYVDNEKFYQAMIEWKKLVNEAEASGEERPPASEFIGECYLKIAENLVLRPNFIGYSFRSDMVSDATEQAITYAHNFNPEKSKNPFGYFTQIMYYAFLRRIAKEKKQMSLKHKIIFESGIMDGMAKVVDVDNVQYIDSQLKYLKNFYNPDK